MKLGNFLTEWAISNKILMNFDKFGITKFEEFSTKLEFPIGNNIQSVKNEFRVLLRNRKM